ncbi:MAG TPA: ABC transporter permease [Vicinamibacterales bacterium]
MSALRGLLYKEALHILRDRRTLIVVLTLPILQVLLFGFAIRTDVRRIRLAVVDSQPDTATLALRQRFAAAGLFQIVAVTPDARALEPLFRSGRAQQAIVFEPGFAGRLGSADPPQLAVITDTSEPNIGAATEIYAETVVQRFEQETAPAGGVRLTPQIRMRFNPTGESSNLFVPGLMAFILTLISALMTAITIAREKETGTIEALLVSPLRPWQVITGKVAPYLLIGFVSAVGVLIAARLVFGVPLLGSPALLLAEAFLFILVSLSLGVLISSRTSSQRVAMMGAMLGTMLPTLLLSGFMFPIESMPAPLRAVSYVVPARWFVEITRAIMLKGAGIADLWRETVILGGMAAVLLAASVRSFHARLD